MEGEGAINLGKQDKKTKIFELEVSEAQKGVKR